MVKYVFISIQYWSSCHYLRNFFASKEKMGRNQCFRDANFITRALLDTLLIFIGYTNPTDSIWGQNVLFKCILYCMAWSLKSMLLNSVYTLYCFKHIFMSVEWYLRGAGESLTAIWTLWYIWSILEIVLLLCSAFGVHFEGKHIFSLCEQSDPLFYALCFITHLIQDQYSTYWSYVATTKI